MCFHYDIGRYCCPGFKERNGFCFLNRKSSNVPGEDRKVMSKDYNIIIYSINCNKF